MWPLGREWHVEVSPTLTLAYAGQEFPQTFSVSPDIHRSADRIACQQSIEGEKQRNKRHHSRLATSQEGISPYALRSHICITTQESRCPARCWLEPKQCAQQEPSDSMASIPATPHTKRGQIRQPCIRGCLHRGGVASNRMCKHAVVAAA